MSQAMEMCPVPDAEYVNVTLQIDPNWPWLGKIGNNIQAKFKKITFTFVDQTESGFQEQTGVNYATSDVVGRDEQFMTFTGTNNKTIPITFHFVGQSEPYGGGGGGVYLGRGGPLAEVVLPTRWIESLQHAIVPDPKIGIAHAPPPLLLTVGRLLAARVVLTDCSFTWEGPFEPGSMLPHASIVECTFTVVRAAMDVEDPFGNVEDVSEVSSYSRFVSLPTQGPIDTKGTHK